MVKKVTHLLVWLTSGGLLLTSLAFVAFATPLVGNRALIVRSGSMEPTIRVGDIVIVRAGTYQVGDAVAYRVPARDSMIVTHRIVGIKDGAYITKGDANAEVDGWVVNDSNIIGKELFVVPWVGKVLAFAKTKAGFFSLVLLPALAVILSELRVIWREMRKKAVLTTPLVGLPFPPIRRVNSRGSKRYLDGLSARVAVILVMVAVMSPATWALFSDSGTGMSNVFAAAELFATPTPIPSPTPSTPSVVINEVMWMGSTSQSNDEWVELRNTTASPVDVTGWTLVNAGAGSSHIVLSGSIPANGFFLVSNFLPTHPNSALRDTFTIDAQANVSLLNDGEQLTLQNASSAVIDQTPLPPGWAAGVNTTLKQSMSRNSTPGDGTVAANWHTCTAAGCNDTTYWDAEANNYGTPKATNL